MEQLPHNPSGPSTEPVYVISVAARLADLPCWVLRVLDQEGIVVPVRTDSNRRLYCDRDIALLSHVEHLMKDRKVNIDGIKVILEMEAAHAEELRRYAAAYGGPPPPPPAAPAPTEGTVNGGGALVPAPIALPPYRPADAANIAP